MIQSLLSPPPNQAKELEEKRKLTAKLIAADKARAAALLTAAIAKLESNSPVVTTSSRRITI
jgi:hypothetical protein